MAEKLQRYRSLDVVYSDELVGGGEKYGQDYLRLVDIVPATLKTAVKAGFLSSKSMFFQTHWSDLNQIED